jgi:replicative DNA helicase
MELAGGRMYLNELLDRTTTTASLEYYADIVKRKAMLRSLIEVGGRISELGYDEVSPIDEVLDKAEQSVLGISSGVAGSDYYLIKDFLYEHVATLEQLHRDPGRHTVTGFSTGFPHLDDMTGGMQRSDLVIVAGRPGTGKTSFLLALARHMAIRDNASIGVFSLEMRKEHLLERLLCGEGKISLHELRGGFLSSAKWRDLAHAAGKLEKAQVIVDDSPGASILEIRARARRMAAHYGLDVVMLDYLQLAEGGMRADRREQEVAYISRSLKKLARELNICVIAASQLNRSPEGRVEKRPRLADLRESGAIEQDADIVMFIYREDYHRQQDEGGTGVPGDTSAPSELIIAKQRNGPVGNVDIMFHKAYASFYPVVGEPRSSASV